ncbi:MAG TPA: hypothetical protein VFG08_10910, partial [Candidatus Polarisedimenticolia bacterium]|nr:hypothetical protein [Candidatus Polarisedimenticolia bacterium]
ADGSCHAGLDAFFGRIFDQVDGIELVTPPGICRPAVMLSIRAVHFGLVFPKRLLLQGFNIALRADPSRVLSDPYGCGWLFAGRVPEGEWHGDRASVSAGLLRGADALIWMSRELHRMTACVHERLSGRTADGEPLAADGGEWQRPATRQLEPATVSLLLHEFFSGAIDGADHESMA